MPTFTVINANTNVVVNSIIAANSSYDPGPGFYLGPLGGSHGDTYDAQSNTFTRATPTLPAIEDIQTSLKSRSWFYMNSALENAYANVVITASNNVSYSFGCDSSTQENIMGINTAISAGVPIPDPRGWFPRGATSPILVSHSDIVAIGAAIMAKKDEYIGNYFTHKAAIEALTDPQAALEYNYTTGYDAEPTPLPKSTKPRLSKG